MSFNFTEIRESVKIKGDKINIKVLTVSGKDGDNFVIISPTLLVSGYGLNETEAKQSFQYNIELFYKDLLQLSSEQRNSHLKNLGFIKGKFKTKNFSKLYVDENGLLHGLEQSTLKTSILKATV